MEKQTELGHKTIPVGTEILKIPVLSTVFKHGSAVLGEQEGTKNLFLIDLLRREN